jgi:hypothetical protein
MNGASLSHFNPTKHSFRVNRETNELCMIQKKEVTIINLIKGIFGFGPLANLDRSIHKIGHCLAEKRQEIEELKTSSKERHQNTLRTITEIANNLFIKESKNKALFEAVSAKRTLILQDHRNGNDYEYKHPFFYYENEQMPAQCMTNQIQEIGNALQEMLIKRKAQARIKDYQIFHTDDTPVYNSRTLSKQHYLSFKYSEGARMVGSFTLHQE